MKLKTSVILNTPITIEATDAILDNIEKYLLPSDKKEDKNPNTNRQPLTIVSINPEIITAALHDKTLKSIITTAQIGIPDGSGIVWALDKIKGIKLDRISGVDLMEKLCARVAKQNVRIGLIGGYQNVALKAADCLQRKYYGIKIDVFEVGEVEILDGMLKMSDETENSKNLIGQIVEWIRKKNIQILFIGLGCPKQELLMSRINHLRSNISANQPLVLMTVGGAFDYISGTVPRAAKWMRERGWEWLYRLMKQPCRLGRQMRGGEFFIRVFLDILKHLLKIGN